MKHLKWPCMLQTEVLYRKNHVDLYVSEDFFISGKELGHSKTLRGKTKKRSPLELYDEKVQSGEIMNTHCWYTQNYTRQYASATWVTHGLRMGCICSPPLACWKINAVEQCSLLLNNVWMGCSRGRLDKGRKERTILLSLTSSACYSRYEVSERGSKLAHAHTKTLSNYNLNLNLTCMRCC